MLSRFMLLISIFMLIGCSAMPNLAQERLSSFPQRHSEYDVKMAWDVKNVAGHTLIDGVVQNVRYEMMEDLEIWVLSFDENGKITSRSADLIVPSRLDLDEIAPFGIKLPILVKPGTKLRFTYSYNGSDGGADGNGASYWMQSFDSVVPASAGGVQ